jgi:SAM-dependent methyltransferase
VRRDWRAFWSQQEDPRYGTDQADFVRDHGREISILLGDPAGKSILELGCGSGTLYRILGFDGSRVYRGVDFSESMLEVFRSTHPEAEVLCADASSYRDSTRYDIVFSNQVVQYFDRRMFEQHVDNARAMLAPGGRFLVCSAPWKSARAAYHLQPANGRAMQYVRQLILLGLSHLGVDRLGSWYSFSDFRRIARRNAFDVRFFGCMHYPYRFHAVFEARASHEPSRLS